MKEAYVQKEYILYASVDMKSGTGTAKVRLEKNQNNGYLLGRERRLNDGNVLHLEYGLHQYIHLLKLMIHLGFMHFIIPKFYKVLNSS